MILSWSAIAFRRKKNRPDAVIIGTDPMFGVAAAIPLRLFAKDIRIVHWCFDLHPEAALEQGTVQPRGLIVRLTKRIMKSAYRSCDVIADIGTCMRRRLRAYDHQRSEIELTPWALAEPEAPLKIDPKTRAELFGSAKLGLLYSGNFGEAHDYGVILQLARRLRGKSEIHFCFAVRGNRAEALKNAVTAEDTNISFAGFAKLEDLEKRLGSADIHIATLKDKWMGIAVPSKFFGSLSAGRPVLYAGAQESAIGAWIRQYKVGWVIDERNLPEVADILAALAMDKSELEAAQRKAFEVYRQKFSRRVVTSEWDSTLTSLIAR